MIKIHVAIFVLFVLIAMASADSGAGPAANNTLDKSPVETDATDKIHAVSSSDNAAKESQQHPITHSIVSKFRRGLAMGPHRAQKTAKTDPSTGQSDSAAAKVDVTDTN